MIEHSTDITKLAEALNAAQSEMRGVAKDASNPHFRNRYASLESVIDTTKPVLTKHGLSFTQAPGALIEGAIEITTMLMHSSGQWIRSTLHMPVAKRDPQGVGSAITYGLRYSLMAVLGVPPTDDDDGERAMDHAPARSAVGPVGRDVPPPRKQPEKPREDTRTSSQRLADEMIAEIEKNPKAATSRQLQKEMRELLDAPDRKRVEATIEATGITLLAG